MTTSGLPSLNNADGHVDFVAIINHLRSAGPCEVTSRGGGIDVHITYENAAAMREHAEALLGDSVEESHQQARYLIKEQSTTRWGQAWEVRLFSELPAREQALLVANAIVTTRHQDSDAIMEAATATSAHARLGAAVTAVTTSADILATLLLDATDGHATDWGWARGHTCADAYSRQPDLLDAAEALARPARAVIAPPAGDRTPRAKAPRTKTRSR